MSKSTGRKCHNPVCLKWNTHKRVTCKHCGAKLKFKFRFSAEVEEEKQKPVKIRGGFNGNSAGGKKK